MASRQAPQVALMSINPGYVEKILAGEKLIELRKTKISHSVSYIIIYATRPRKEIMGFFEVEGFDEGSPLELWERYQSVSGMDADDYWDYFDDTQKGFIIKIGRVFPLENPQPLRELFSDRVVPQNFYYVDREIINYLFENTVRRKGI